MQNACKKGQQPGGHPSVMNYLERPKIAASAVKAAAEKSKPETIWTLQNEQLDGGAARKPRTRRRCSHHRLASNLLCDARHLWGQPLARECVNVSSKRCAKDGPYVRRRKNQAPEVRTIETQDHAVHCAQQLALSEHKRSFIRAFIYIFLL